MNRSRLMGALASSPALGEAWAESTRWNLPAEALAWWLTISVWQWTAVALPLRLPI